MYYEDLKSLYAATAKERDELKRENEYLRKIVEKQSRMNRATVTLALELDKVTEDRDALKARLEGKDG